MTLRRSQRIAHHSQLRECIKRKINQMANKRLDRLNFKEAGEKKEGVKRSSPEVIVKNVIRRQKQRELSSRLDDLYKLRIAEEELSSRLDDLNLQQFDPWKRRTVRRPKKTRSISSAFYHPRFYPADHPTMPSREILYHHNKKFLPVQVVHKVQKFRDIPSKTGGLTCFSTKYCTIGSRENFESCARCKNLTW